LQKVQERAPFTKRLKAEKSPSRGEKKRKKIKTRRKTLTGEQNNKKGSSIKLAREQISKKVGGGGNSFRKKNEKKTLPKIATPVQKKQKENSAKHDYWSLRGPGHSITPDLQFYCQRPFQQQAL